MEVVAAPALSPKCLELMFRSLYPNPVTLNHLSLHADHHIFYNEVSRSANALKKQKGGEERNSGQCAKTNESKDAPT